MQASFGRYSSTFRRRERCGEPLEAVFGDMKPEAIAAQPERAPDDEASADELVDVVEAHALAQAGHCVVAHDDRGQVADGVEKAGAVSAPDMADRSPIEAPPRAKRLVDIQGAAW